jgi:hypothetical protein
MKAVVIILSILAFAACLIIGIQAGSNASHSAGSSATDTPNPWISPSQQRTILVIVADDLSKSDPQLQAVWLALYRPDLPKLTMLPLYPTSATVAGTPAPDLAGAFKLTGGKKPSSNFYKTLTSFHIQWNGYLMTDQAAISSSIDWMQGIELDGNQVTGPAALESLSPPSTDVSTALTGQKRLLGAICQRMANLPVEANWVGLADSLKTSHLDTDLQIQTLVADWKGMMSATAPFSCDIPVP